jgi:hypothetical protein
MVYLWVNGADPKWAAKKNAALVKAGRVPPTAATANRFDDNYELKYALRSMEKFAPWINHVYIVTDNQRPDWLNDNPKVTVVDHKDIIPKDYLPVFNSNAIEMFLGNIAGLSEHFLFANDDFFFNRPVRPDFFFDKDGNPIVMMQEKPWSDRVFKTGKVGNIIARDKSFKLFVANTIHFIYKKTGRKYNIMLTHAIEPMRKSYFQENFNENKDEILRTTVTTFRADTNLQRTLFPLLDNAKGRNTITLKRRFFGTRMKYHGKYPILYHIAMLLGLLTGLAKTDLVDSTRNTTKKIKARRPMMIALNAISENFNMFTENKKYMDELLPEKSSFEK